MGKPRVECKLKKYLKIANCANLNVYVHFYDVRRLQTREEISRRLECQKRRHH